ncbi:class I SAM-dependent methyltransferase [Planococcus lenghuensis]|uniref:16S rRNA (Cytosine(1402)-N(4))-methyltransferase n=1 Tax=Planococcus lenghuensis TaxID=2213202 RepID=A0A1Q2KY86_9BACL|nr:class I SAM-dependent methyltransferase [Planococcus lenghuensis]AQQ52757.1 16S rRNA (cytosine(1402)-N(4))-methyltransferase [Planococcus lenghuensis]
MILQRVLPFSKELLKQVVTPGDLAVDATAGNGHDTLFLAELTGPSGRVIAFDIQEAAIEATRERVKDHDHVELVLGSHAEMDRYANRPVAAVVFNLGYLPKGDHSIITKPDSTLEAIRKGLDALKIGGLVILIIYYGHAGGVEEKDAVLDFVSGLPQKDFDVLRYGFINQQNSPPFLIAIEKKRQ